MQTSYKNSMNIIFLTKHVLYFSVVHFLFAIKLFSVICLQGANIYIYGKTT